LIIAVGVVSMLAIDRGSTSILNDSHAAVRVTDTLSASFSTEWICTSAFTSPSTRPKVMFDMRLITYPRFPPASSLRKRRFGSAVVWAKAEIPTAKDAIIMEILFIS